nr:hypothetical protein [Tanacetum cinerariifolium]
MRNMINLHTICDDSLLDTLKFVSKTQDYQQYEALILDDMINQDIKDSQAYKTYYDFAIVKVPPKKARKYKKVASPPRKLSPVQEAEPVKKGKRVKRPAKKSTTAPKTCIVLRDTLGVPVSKKKAPAKGDRSKGIEILSDVALSEAAQLKEATKRIKIDFHISQASGSGDGTNLELWVLDEKQRKTFGTDEGTSTKLRVPDVPTYDSKSENESWGDSEDGNDNESDYDSKGDDDKADNDDGNFDAEDNEMTDLDDNDENPSFTLKDYEEEEHDKESLGTEHEKERQGDEKMTDVDQNVSQELPYEQVVEDVHVTLTASQKTHDSKQSSSVSSDFASKFLILENVIPGVDEVASMIHVKKTTTAHATIVSLTISMITPPLQLTTPSPAPTTVPTRTLILALPDFSSLSGFDKRVSTLETELSQLKQADLSTQLLESIKSQLPTMVDDLLSIRIGYANRTVLESYTKDFEKKAQEERKLNIDVVEKSVKDIIKDEVKKHRNLYDELIKSYELDKDLFDSYGKAYSLKRSCDDKDKDEDPLAGSYQWLKKKKTSKDAEPPKGSKSRESKTSSSRAYVMHNLKIDNQTQEILIGPAFNLFKGTCKSFIELEYHFEECYRSIMDQLDWNNPEGHEYPFDLSKPLPLIEAQGRQVVPADYFLNNDLKYLKCGSSSKKYITSTTMTKAARYDNIKGIKDMFHGYASNGEFKHDVFSRKRIIVATHVKVMKWYGYGYLEEIIIRREDESLHKFKEGDFPRLTLRDIKDLLLLLVQKKLSNLDQYVIFNLNVALRMFTKRFVILKRIQNRRDLPMDITLDSVEVLRYEKRSKKTCKNDKNLSEIQLEHEKEDELVAVVVKVVHELKEIVNKLIEKVEVNLFGNKMLECWFEQDINDEGEEDEEGKGGSKIYSFRDRCSSYDFHEEGFDGLKEQHWTRKRHIKTKRKSWNEMIHHHFHQRYHPTDEKRVDDLKW